MTHLLSYRWAQNRHMDSPHGPGENRPIEGAPWRREAPLTAAASGGRRSESEGPGSEVALMRAELGGSVVQSEWT